MYSFDDRERFIIEKGLSEDQIFQDEWGKEFFYEVDERGVKEKVYLEDVVLMYSPDQGREFPPGDY